MDDAKRSEVLAEAQAAGAQVVYVIHMFPDAVEVDVSGTVDVAVAPITGNIEVDVVVPTPIDVPVAIQLVPGTPVHN